MAGADERGRILLALARESLGEAFGRTVIAEHPEPWLDEPGATFVTLRRGLELRGCVGSIRAYRPLREDVRSNARAAAFSDTRFPPLERGELDEIHLEVSLLSEPEILPVRGQDEALRALRPGIDGVILECGEYRATFLPQVWDQLPDARTFLAQLKRKAGLPPGDWHPDLQLWRYTVTHWEE
jgi:AmmeMemoRadiSam system protein A